MIYSNGEYSLIVNDLAGNVAEVKFTVKELSLDGILKRIKADPKNEKNYLIYKNNLERLRKLKKIKMFVNGNLINFRLYENAEPVLLNDKIMVPFNAVADYLGIRYYWEDETKEYVMRDENKKVTLKYLEIY